MSSARVERPRGWCGRLLWRVADGIMMVLTVLTVVALLGAMLARVVSPDEVVYLSFLGLLYPIIYLANIFCALWWIVRWRRWVWLSLFVLLLGLGQIGLFYRPDFSVERDNVTKAKNDIVLATYNVMNFSDEENFEGEKDNMDRIVEWVNDQGVNLLAIQEAHFSASQTFDLFKSKLRRMKYGYFHHAEVDKEGQLTGSGYVLMSAYPIVRRGVAEADSLQVHSLWADLRVGRDTIRIYNNHLQSTGVSKTDRTETLSKQILADSQAHDKLASVTDKMMKNYRLRATQADKLVAHCAESPYAVIMAGDFNDTPVSYVYNKLRTRRMGDAFVEAGRGVEHTFKGLFNLFRIDYVLFDQERFYVKEYSSEDQPMSDHKPVVVRLGVVEEFED